MALQATRKIVVHKGSESFPMGNGVEAITLCNLCDALGKQG